MPTPQSLPQEKHGLSESTGVLVVNLGTPDAPTTIAVRRFLKQFLSDPHVIDYPRLIWWLVLNLVILQIRPSRSAAAYRKIWTEEGSPLRIHSADIAAGLQKQLDRPDRAPSPDSKNDKIVGSVNKGVRIQIKYLRHFRDAHAESVQPIGHLLDGPHAGVKVSLRWLLRERIIGVPCNPVVDPDWIILIR